jgi:hypothetical protein
MGVVVSSRWWSGLKELTVGVVVFDGLEWVLAWRQLGVKSIYVEIVTDKGREQMFELLQQFGPYLKSVQVINSCAEHKLDLLSTIIGTGDQARSFFCRQELPGTTSLVLSTARARGDPSYGVALPRLWTWTSSRHSKLGGLTAAHCWFGTTSAEPVSTIWGSISQQRSRWKFLESSTPLLQWEDIVNRRSRHVWAPERIAALAPWPIPTDLWIEAHSVFFGKSILRPLNAKEWAQLVDLRPEWGSILRDVMGTWRDGCVVPLRFGIELGIWSAVKLRVFQEFECPVVDNAHFGCQLAPRLCVANGLTTADLVKYNGWVWEPEDSEDVAVATTDDDAAVQYHLWAVGGFDPTVVHARAVLCRWLWCRWYRAKYRNALEWLRAQDHSSGDHYTKNREAIRDCLERLAHSSWFEWDDGSRLHFWLWPPCWRLEARDGTPARIRSRPPPRLRWPAIPQEDWAMDLDATKLVKLIHRRYLEEGPVLTTVPRFQVPKGDNDIRVVWDLTKNLVNAGVAPPRFFLLGFTSLVLRVPSGVFFADFDVGEMFQNFILHEAERPYIGVDITPECRRRLVALGLPTVPRSLRWSRLLFGWANAPFSAVSMMMRGVELAQRSPADETSQFRVAVVFLNLPGSASYDPSKPRIILLRSDGTLASVAVIFVDDGRVFAVSLLLVALAIRQLTAGLQFYGIQDAGRKRELGGQRPRAWTGGVVHTDQGSTRKFVVKAKWHKLQAFISFLLSSHGTVDRKRFESGLGFLVHISAVYDFLRPYLVGFYLAQHQFRSGRDSNGWLRGGDRVQQDLFEDELDRFERRTTRDGCNDLGDGLPTDTEGGGYQTSDIIDDEEMPPTVPLTPLLLRNAQTIQRLTAGEVPVQRLVRPTSSVVAYGASDASGEGFGGRVEEVDGATGDDVQTFFYGYWGDATDSSTSNWREMRAVVDRITTDALSGKLAGRELWFATDNEVLERAFHKGYSSSDLLYGMVEDLWSLCVRGNFILRIVHIAGTRMIDLGVDGLSRGDIEFAPLATSLRSQIPLNLSPLERSPSLRQWLEQWMGPSMRVAAPLDWIYNAQLGGVYDFGPTFSGKPWVWDLPPGAGLFALEELALGRTKRLDHLCGVVLIPALLMPEWYRRFSKVVDVFFRIPAGAIPEWPSSMHEPLTVGIFLPTLGHDPWDWSRVAWMGNFGRALSAKYKAGDPQAGLYLREFWDGTTTVRTMPASVVRPLLLNDSWKAFIGFTRRRRSNTVN